MAQAIQRDVSKIVQLGRATIFQIFHTMATQKNSPLHILVSETIHDVSQSKKLITLMNQLGIAISNDEMNRIDTALAKEPLKQLVRIEFLLTMQLSVML